MTRSKLPGGLRKYIRHQKEQMRRQAATHQEADQKIREFLAVTIKKEKYWKGT